MTVMPALRFFLSRCLLAGGILLGGLLPAAVAQNSAAAVKQIFTTHCLECHGGKKVSLGVRILDRDLLVKQKRLVPGKPNESTLLQLVTDKTGEGMPPPDRPRLSSTQVDAIRRWIAEGAPSFPTGDTAVAATSAADNVKAPLPVDYILQSILTDLRQLPAAQRRSARYLSLVNVLNAGTTREELNQYRDALAKVINHLSWQRDLVGPVAIEPTHTVYRIDIHALGWDQRPFQKVVDGKPAEASPLNLWDLVLLDYPYGTVYRRTDAYSALVREFLVPTGQVRPIPYVRADWFVSVATQPPLYHELLQLPRTLPELEKLLGVDADADVANFRAVRGGMINSGVSRNNRAVERHVTGFGAYWKSADFKSSSEKENLLADPIKLHPTGGEMIFNLPNGLQAYFVANGKGQRVDAAPTEIVTDRLANDKIVRNGLSCIRCHDAGMQPVTDVVRSIVAPLANTADFDRRDVLRLYGPQDRLDKLLAADGKRFQTAMEKVLGHAVASDPLTPVSQHFLYNRVTLAEASAELGLAEPRGLKELFRLPQFVNEGLAPFAANQPVARDAWEEYYDRVVGQLGLGVPMVPLDGLTRENYQAGGTPFTLEVRTNKSKNLFKTGEEVVLVLKANKDVHVEVIATGSRGHKVVLAPATTRLKAGQELQKKVTAPSEAGDLQVSVLASEVAFPTGELLRGTGVADRVVHAFPVHVSGKKAEVQVAPDPGKTVKKTITVTVQ
jgi:mono/diheme cytochrome c family protein